MKRILVTGGAGFIGRWMVKRLLSSGHKVVVLDDFSNGRYFNIAEFEKTEAFTLVEGDIKDRGLLELLFRYKFDLVYHLAAGINVQDSIDEPRTVFDNDVVGTFNILESCRQQWTKMVFMSTCMVYDRSHDLTGINEEHRVKPASPYAASKLAGEALTLSYYYTYGLPAVVVRPFNTYGPFQKSTGEGGVVAIFIKRDLLGQELNIFGDGTQTRDLLYVEDCADFVINAGEKPETSGHILNAGLGTDISINALANFIATDANKIKHVPHIHPQSEIAKLLCNYGKAHNLLGWRPRIDLKEGIKRTRDWIVRYDLD